MIPNSKRSKTQERRYAELMAESVTLQADMRAAHLKDLIIPADWHEISKEPPKGRGRRITLSLDEDVYKWYHGMGRGYQATVNRVLRAFMLGVISKELEGAFERDWKGDPL